MNNLRSNQLLCMLLIVLLLLSSVAILAQDDDSDDDSSDDYSDEYSDDYDDDYSDEYDDEYDDDEFTDDYDDDYSDEYDDEYSDDYYIDCDSSDISDEDYEAYCGYIEYIDCGSPDILDEDYEAYCAGSEEYIDCESDDISDEDYELYCDFDYEDYYDEYGDFIEFEEFEDNFVVGSEVTSGNVESEFDVSDGATLAGTPADAEQQLWNAFASIIPAEWVARVSSFEVINDPETAGYVYVDENDPTKFVLALNVEELNDPDELNHTIVHEFAHILTLNSDQISSNSGSCSTLALDEGCTNGKSYINEFNSQFWATNAEGFVSDYASTNVAEDIAESFTAFVLRDRAAGNSVADQKINFFYNYPKLVQLRQELRANLANAS